MRGLRLAAGVLSSALAVALGVLALVVAAQALVYDSGATFGDVTITGTLTSTKACATGYTRVAPNFCRRTAAIGAGDTTPITDSTTCQTKTLTTVAPVPAEAKMVQVTIAWAGLSSAAVGQRFNEINFADNTSCTGGGSAYGWRAGGNFWEFVSTTAGSQIGKAVIEMTIPLTGTNQVSHVTQNAGGNGNIDFGILLVTGYFD